MKPSLVPVLLSATAIGLLCSSCSRSPGSAAVQATSQSDSVQAGTAVGTLLDRRGMPDERITSGPLDVWVYRDEGVIRRYYLRDFRVVSVVEEADAVVETDAGRRSAGALLDREGLPDERLPAGAMTVWLYRDGDQERRYYLRDHEVVSSVSASVLTPAASAGKHAPQSHERPRAVADTRLSAGALLDREGLPDERLQAGAMTVWLYRDGDQVRRYYLRDHRVQSMVASRQEGRAEPGLDPTRAADPQRYIRSFPLGIQGGRLLDQAGPPDARHRAGPLTVWRYDVAAGSYRFYLRDFTVVEVVHG